MTLFNKLTGTYQAKLKCTNCGEVQMAVIKRGLTIKEFLKTNNNLCVNCGCLLQEIKEEAK